MKPWANRPKILKSLSYKFFRQYSHINVALLDQAMVSGTNFLTGILFARFLGVEEFGRFTLTWMAVLFINSIQMAMITVPMMSIGPKQTKDKAPYYYGAVITQQACFSILSFITIYLGVKFSKFVYPEWNIDYLALPLAAVTFFFQNQDFLRRFFFTMNRHGMAFINDSISYIGQLILLICLFFTTSMDTTSVLFVIAGTSALSVISGIFFLNGISWQSNVFFQVFKTNWHFSKWITASAVLQWTSGNLFIVAAGSILGPTVVGAIKAAQNIMGVSHILFQGLENIVPVKASYNYVQEGIQGLITYLNKTVLWGGLATAIIAFTAGLMPKFWLILFYGEQYQEFGFILQWYAVIYLLIFIGLPLRAGLRAIETTRPIFIAYVLMTIFSIFTAKYSILFFGVHGVMVGILGTQVILQSSLLLSLNHNIKKLT